MNGRLPVLAFCGPSQAGKETAARWVAACTPLVYPGSLARYLLPHVARREDLSEIDAWDQRHINRRIWAQAALEYTRDDPARLVRDAVARGHLIVGCSSGAALAAALAERLVDLTIWIDRVRPEQGDARAQQRDEPGPTFGPRDCHISVDNNGSVDELYNRIGALLRFADIPICGSGDPC
jgi:hypothetical protein